MSMSKWIRQVHRWLAILFTLTVIANFAAMARGTPPAFITYSPLPPPFLLVRGEVLREDALAVAVVGSRRGTPYGLRMAERLAAEISRIRSFPAGCLSSHQVRPIPTAIAISPQRIAKLTACWLKNSTGFGSPRYKVAHRLARRGEFLSQAQPREPTRGAVSSSQPSRTRAGGS